MHVESNALWIQQNLQAKQVPSDNPLCSLGSHSRIPWWEELVDCSLSQSSDPNFKDKVGAFKQKPPPTYLMRLARGICQVILRDPSHRKFINSSWEEIVDLIATQVAENNWIRLNQGINSEDLAPAILNYSRSNRKYMQQPCTNYTVKKRVKLAKLLCKREDNILLLGDDDMVGLELAKAGFTNVTIVDIDAKIIRLIAKIKNTLNLPISLFLHDITNPPPQKALKDYRLVFLDPFYSIEGVKLFLGAALRFTRQNHNYPHYFLSVHLMSLFQTGLNDLGRLFDDMGLIVDQYYHSFNTYPIPSSVRILLGLVNSVITNLPAIRSERHSFKYFTSDGILLSSV